MKQGKMGSENVEIEKEKQENGVFPAKTRIQ